MNCFYPFIHQTTFYNCGPACLAMILNYYNKNISLEEITRMAYTNIYGTNILNMCNTCQKLNLIAKPIKINHDAFYESFTLPCIAQVINGSHQHFVVIYEKDDFSVLIADPGDNIKKIIISDFFKYFNGVLILIEHS